MDLQNELILTIVKNGAYVLNGRFDLTIAGIPRIIYKSIKSNFSCSIVFSGRKKLWKAFTPFPAEDNENQKRHYFKTLLEVKEFINEQENKS